ncbi:MAG: 3',5'-cyclic-AMP phosphodiesterase [Aeromonadaceae bacterium]|nr:3',5'-cyclic-AMP phosphodiesterase [Aeromonadaceae bacterium]
MDTVSLLPAQDAVVRLLQISDSHLYAEADGRLLGVRTADSFNAVIKAIVDQKLSYDLVLATGDLSQDYSTGSYQRFAQAVRPLAKPLFWLPGNHDDGPLMRNVMPEVGISNARQILLPRWQILMLDTQVYGVPHGWIKPDQLGFLEHCLASQPERFALVCLHHHCHPVGCGWLDQHDLKNANHLLDLLARYPKTRLVLGGHVHQEYDQVHNGIRFLTSPSTCIQFMPGCNDFTLDDAGPGWRYLQLYADGHVATQVWRLPTGSFLPESFATGY